MAPLKIFTLGNTGVVIDQQTLNPAIPDDALQLAQNTTHDPRLGRSTAITKRLGLARFNIEFAGGVILGGIPMPVAGFGGAPASGGGAIVGTGDSDNGSSVGTGDMTGSPGGTFDGGAAATTPAGAGQFNGGTTIFGGARLFVTGRLGSDATVGQEGGSGWFVSSKGLADSATVRIPPGPPICSYDFPPTAVFSGAWGSPSCVDLIGPTGLYYAAAYGDQTIGTDATPGVGTGPKGNPIRRTNGGADVLLATVPVATAAQARTDYPTTPTAGRIRSAIIFMHYGLDGFVYLGVKDKYYGQNTNGSCGRVYRLAPLDGSLVEWIMLQVGEGDGTTFEQLPYCGCYFDGYLYVGTFPGVINEVATLRATNGSNVDPTLGGSFVGTVGHPAYALHSSLCVYNGRLFLGTGIWETTPSFAGVWSRRPGTPDFGFSAWDKVFDATGGAAGNGNYFPSMTVFNDALYVSFFNPGVVGKIYKLVADEPGNPLNENFTVTTVATLGNFPYTLHVDDGILYAVGALDGASSESAYVTSDGTTWTNQSANLPAGGTSSSVRPIFFGVNQ